MGWRDGAIPFAMEGVSGHVEGFELLFGDFDAFFVDGRTESGVYGQAGFGRCGADILRCIVERTQGLGSPIGGKSGQTCTKRSSSLWWKNVDPEDHSNQGPGNRLPR
jgi:hypothetical protein